MAASGIRARPGCGVEMDWTRRRMVYGRKNMAEVWFSLGPSFYWVSAVMGELAGLFWGALGPLESTRGLAGAAKEPVAG